jgi:hypothetical protein
MWNIQLLVCVAGMCTDKKVLYALIHILEDITYASLGVLYEFVCLLCCHAVEVFT